MDNDVFQYFKDIPVKEIAPGFFSQLIHTENNTINFVKIKAGCSIPVHQHIHHQCAFALDGKFELVVNGDPQILEPGARFAVVPSNVPHGGRAITDCVLLDIFSPIREDYRNL